MPLAMALHESTLLGLQSNIGLALTHSLDLHNQQVALVRNDNLQRNVISIIAYRDM